MVGPMDFADWVLAGWMAVAGCRYALIIGGRRALWLEFGEGVLARALLQSTVTLSRVAPRQRQAGLCDALSLSCRACSITDCFKKSSARFIVPGVLLDIIERKMRDGCVGYVSCYAGSSARRVTRELKWAPSRCVLI
jgi:hypothetical protein